MTEPCDVLVDGWPCRVVGAHTLHTRPANPYTPGTIAAQDVGRVPITPISSCPMCGKPLLTQVSTGAQACSDPDCELAHG